MSSAPQEDTKLPRTLVEATSAVRTDIGSPFPPIPERVTDAEIETMEQSLFKDHQFDSYQELARYSTLMYARRSLRFEADMKFSERNRQVNRLEYITANQAVTYYEYMPQALEVVTSVMEEYQKLRNSIHLIPEETRKKEDLATRYMQALHTAIRERVVIGNILLTDGQLAQHFGDTPRLLASREEALKVLMNLNKRSYDTMFGRPINEKHALANSLDQRIIEILAGKATIDGVPEGFLPQELLTDLLTERYTQLVEEQQRLARDSKSRADWQRFEALRKKNDRATEKKGEPLTGEEAKEYERLRSFLKVDKSGFDEKAKERSTIMQALVDRTQELGEYQITMEELTTIQHHFGGIFDLTGAGMSDPYTTPEKLQTAIAQAMEERQKFHAERLRTFLKNFEEDVLSAGPLEKIEDLYTSKGGREIVFQINERLASLVTILLPETLGIRNHYRSKLTRPLREAMGWPTDLLETPMKKLTEEDWARIANGTRECSQSILGAIKEFKAANRLAPLHSSVETVAALPPASQFLGQDVRVPLPERRGEEGPITTKNLEECITRYGGPTTFAMLFRQLDTDWGSTKPPAGFMEAYDDFFKNVNKNIDVHLDVGRATYTIGNDWMWIAYGIGGGALLLLLLSTRTGRRIVLGPLRFARDTTRSVARGALSQLRVTMPQTPGSIPESPSLARFERLRKTFGSRGFGHAAFIALEVGAVIEIARRMNIQLHMEKLPDIEAVSAALEFLQTHPNVDRSAARYESEVQSVIHRHELLTMEAAVTDRIIELKPADSPEEETLIARGQDLLRRIKEEERDLYRYFPITDYLRRSSADPEGVLRVFYHRLNEARGTGMKQGTPTRTVLSWLRRPHGAALPDAAPQAPEDPELRAQLAEFAATLRRDAASIDADGPYAAHAEIVENLTEEYEGWMREVV